MSTILDEVKSLFTAHIVVDCHNCRGRTGVIAETCTDFCSALYILCGNCCVKVTKTVHGIGVPTVLTSAYFVGKEVAEPRNIHVAVLCKVGVSCHVASLISALASAAELCVLAVKQVKGCCVVVNLHVSYIHLPPVACFGLFVFGINEAVALESGVLDVVVFVGCKVVGKGMGVHVYGDVSVLVRRRRLAYAITHEVHSELQ